jgi:hypothetical protein
MKILFLAHVLVLALSSGAATAGFRDPMESSGGRAKEIETAGPRSSGLVVGKAAPAAREPASILSTAYGPVPPPGHKPEKQMQSSFPWGQIPKAPGLPSAPGVEIPSVKVSNDGTVTIFRDPLPPIQMSTRNNAQIHNFSRQARMQLLPTRQYGTTPRSPEIANRYSTALKPFPHRTIRTPLKITLAKTGKIENPPAPIQYENMVKRLDALFDGLNLNLAAGIQNLWELSQSKSNAEPMQARDALFAGILSRRAGWETIAGNLLEDSAAKKVDLDERYLRILWNELDSFATMAQVDRVTAKVNPLRAQSIAPLGDQPNFSMAKRVLAGRAHPAIKAESFEARIGSPALQERVQLIRALSHLRLPKGNKDLAFSTLRRLESVGQEELKEDARLALARALLQKGEHQESLELYRRVSKTGKNRLEVLGEQSYAELRSGLPQDSLGKSMGLQSPYFQYGFAPDIHLVEILSRKALCDFGGAEAGIQRFSERYGREMQAINEVLNRAGNPREFYEELISFHAKPEPMRFQRFLLRLAAVMENQKVLNQAGLELEKVSALGEKKYTQKRPAGWDQFVAAMQKSWAGKSLSLKEESARTALAEADYMVKRLRQTFGQVELLSLDVATGATRNFNLQSAMNFPVRKIATVEIEQDRFHWPFEDEIWEDELDFLKMKNPSKCARVATQSAQ